LGFDQKLIGTLLLSHAHIPHVGSSYDV